MSDFGKISFLLLYLLGILVAPLSGTTSAHAQHAAQYSAQHTDQHFVQHTGQSVHHAMTAHVMTGRGSAITPVNAEVPSRCEKPDCCENCPHDGQMAPALCDSCDAACQNSCSPLSAFIKDSNLNIVRLSRIILSAESFDSVMVFRPDALNPPPRA